MLPQISRQRFSRKTRREDIQKNLYRQYDQNPYLMEERYESSIPQNTTPPPWFKELYCYPPENFSSETFREAWNLDWGTTKGEFYQKLAETLQLRDRNGSLRPIENVVHCLRKDFATHGEMKYEWKAILWSIHKEWCRQYREDYLYVHQLVQRDIS